MGTAEGKAISRAQEIPHFATHQAQAVGHLQSIPALCVSSQGFRFPANLPPSPAGCQPGAAPAVWRPVWCMFWAVGKAQCSCVTVWHTQSLGTSEGQNSTEGETSVLSSYSLTFPRLFPLKLVVQDWCQRGVQMFGADKKRFASIQSP